MKKTIDSTEMELQQNSVRIMSFNIRYANPDDKPYHWQNRKSKAASMLRFHCVDIAGIQEALNYQVEDLQKLLADYSWFGVGRDDGQAAGEFCPVFYLKNKFKLLKHSTFWLSDTPNRPGSKGWDAVYPRIVTWAKFEDISTNQVFFLFNTHFDNSGEKAREESAKLILQKVDEIVGNEPVIITGDFNMEEASLPYDILTGPATPPGIIEPFRDAIKISKYPHHGPSWTFHDFDRLNDRPRIDYIFVNQKINVLQHVMLPDHWDGAYPSDHLPVVADVQFE